MNEDEKTTAVKAAVDQSVAEYESYVNDLVAVWKEQADNFSDFDKTVGLSLALDLQEKGDVVSLLVVAIRRLATEKIDLSGWSEDGADTA